MFVLGEVDRLSRGDPAILATYFMLSAASRGLGTCWIGLGSRPSDVLKVEIGLTDDMEIVAPLCLGYPRSIPDVPERKPANILNKIG